MVATLRHKTRHASFFFFFAYLWKQGKTAQRRAHQQRSTMMGVLVFGMLAAVN